MSTEPGQRIHGALKAANVGHVKPWEWCDANERAKFATAEREYQGAVSITLDDAQREVEHMAHEYERLVLEGGRGGQNERRLIALQTLLAAYQVKP
jgi:hypothetical protein